ncbi:MAG TPA: DoxX family protein [Saprospiraceae bacterium]|nr:DoxX family protein [Saprospiraceae bacterium]HPN68611.1 DoxX family protein [Saprospiraceae bacterium]
MTKLKAAFTGLSLLRYAMVVILLTHSIPGFFNGGVHDFGELYLNQVGFAPIGIPIAWAVKLSHVVSAVLLVINKYIKLACLMAIFVFIVGIIMIHFKEGWFVVGGGRNGMEYNFLLICVCLAIMYPTGFVK